MFMPRCIRLLSLFLLLPFFSLAQDGEPQTAIVRGHLVFNGGISAIATDVQVTIPGLQRLTTTDADGSFSFSRVPYGEYLIVFGGTQVRIDSIKIVVAAPVVDLKDIAVQAADGGNSMQSLQIPTLALEESDASNDDEGVQTQNVGGLLTASRDPFLSTAAFIFGPYRFQPRGYERNTQQVLINGSPMNDVETGDAFWSQWGGLNDVFRGRSNTYGLQPSEFTFGGVNGSVYFDATAASQRKQTRVTYSLSNRNYRNRLMLTKSSGLMANGWAYSVSLSRRWAQEGYIEGTFYDGYSYYAAVSKKIAAHTFNFTTFGAPTERGKMAPATQEAYDLAGSNFYNPNWGYQGGEKRNARVATSFQPVFMLNHEYSKGRRFRINTALTHQFGKIGDSRLDWFNGRDPRPDYYRYMPSVFALEGKDPAQADFLSRKQIDWDELYNDNYSNFENYHGTLGRRSIYVMGNDVDDISKWVGNTILEYVVNDHITLYGGATYINQKTESYRELMDLMGGDFYINENQFATDLLSGTALGAQNDLNNPFRIVKEGDKYFYNYYTYFNRALGWLQATFSYNKLDFFAAVNGGANSFQREGLYRNALFAEGNGSFGKGELQSFGLLGAKAGLTYKLTGRHFVFANGFYQTDAPTPDNTFISPRTRNYVVFNPQEQKTASVEGGYLMKSPKLNLRAVGYATTVTDATEIKRFFLEGNSNAFVNYVLEGVDMRFMGTELAAEIKVNPTLAVTGVASVGQAIYTSNPNVSLFSDLVIDSLNNGGFDYTETSYLKNHFVSNGPQHAYSLGLNYRSPKYWYVNLAGSYFDHNYVDVAAPRRTRKAAAAFEPGSENYIGLLSQEKFKPAFTLDLFAGYSILMSKYFRQLPRNTFVYINVGVSNLLDNREIRTGGFENLRADYKFFSLDRFQSKYFYAYGRNFFINLSVKI